jgi:excisionase family DNA binding protein
MDTVPNNGKRTQNRNLTATILPINRGSDGSYTSPPYENSDYPDDHSETPRRLTFTVDEAAFLLNISRGLAYELVARGELGSIRLGRRIVVPRVVLEELTGTSID